MKFILPVVVLSRWFCLLAAASGGRIQHGDKVTCLVVSTIRGAASGGIFDLSCLLYTWRVLAAIAGGAVDRGGQGHLVNNDCSTARHSVVQ